MVIVVSETLESLGISVLKYCREIQGDHLMLYLSMRVSCLVHDLFRLRALIRRQIKGRARLFR